MKQLTSRIKSLYYATFKRALLEETIKNAFKGLNYADNGGCGKIAKIIGEELEARGFYIEIAFVVNPEECEFTVFFEKTGCSNIEEALLKGHEMIQNKELERRYLPFHHIAVKVGNRYFDSTGDLTEHDKFYSQTISLELLTFLVSIPRYWNRKFRRSNSKSRRSNMKKKASKVFAEML